MLEIMKKYMIITHCSTGWKKRWTFLTIIFCMKILSKKTQINLMNLGSSKKHSSHTFVNNN